MEHNVRGSVRRLLFWLALPALAGCTFDPAGASAVDGFDAGADAEPSELTDAAPADAAEVDAARADAAPPDAAPPPDATPPPPDARTCPTSYTVLAATGHAYRVRHSPQPWFQAADSCEATGAGIHLAVIDDAAELAAVDAFVTSSIVWIGVNDVDLEGHFVKVTGGPATFLPWAQGEPNDSGGAEDCVELVGHDLNDDRCDTQLPFLCECE
jgi:hypothetical protein